MPVPIVMLFVVLSTFVVVQVHGFRRVISVAASVATPLRHDVSFRPPSAMSSVTAVHPRSRFSFTVNPKGAAVSSQVPLLKELVILRGGANFAAVRRLNQAQFALFKLFLLRFILIVALKTIEGLWFYVLPHIWATLRRHLFIPTVHIYSWKELWWPVAHQHRNYTQNLFLALENGFWLEVLISCWKDEVSSVLRDIREFWPWRAFATWTLAVPLGVMALGHIVLLYLVQGIVFKCWRNGKRALVEIAHDDTDRVKRVVIASVLVVTTCALYYPLRRWKIS